MTHGHYAELRGVNEYYFDSNMGGKNAQQLALLFDGRAQETESVMSY